MDVVFTIADVIPLGDPDSGESHIVTLHHGCKEGLPGSVTARFGKIREGKFNAFCSACASQVKVVKRNGGDIFIQGQEA